MSEDSNSQDSSNAQHQTKESDGAVDTLSEESNGNTKEKRSYKDKIYRYLCRLTSWKWTEILLVIFNGLLAIFTYLLWDSTDKLWKSAESQLSVMKAQFIPHIKKTMFSYEIRNTSGNA